MYTYACIQFRSGPSNWHETGAENTLVPSSVHWFGPKLACIRYVYEARLCRLSPLGTWLQIHNSDTDPSIPPGFMPKNS